jgi:uncharacterized membrane protein
MSDAIQTPSPPPDSGPPANAFSDDRQMALIIYILYLLPLGGLTHVVGLVLAYVSRESAPEWLRSHYTLQIRTFWMSLLYFAIATVLCITIIGLIVGVPLFFAITVWLVVRCVLGISRLMRNEAYPTPLSWTV